jgi:hypothetical protein
MNKYKMHGIARKELSSASGTVPTRFKSWTYKVEGCCMFRPVTACCGLPSWQPAVALSGQLRLVMVEQQVTGGATKLAKSAARPATSLQQ